MKPDGEFIQSVLCNLETLEGRIQQLRALLHRSTPTPSEVKLLAHIVDDAQSINFAVPYLEFRAANRGYANLASHWQIEITPSVVSDTHEFDVRSMLETVSL